MGTNNVNAWVNAHCTYLIFEVITGGGGGGVYLFEANYCEWGLSLNFSIPNQTEFS